MRFISILFCSLILLSLVAAIPALRADDRDEKTDTIIFAVQKELEPTGRIFVKPVVIIHQGKYLQPTYTEADTGDTSLTPEFVAGYYSPGQKYRLLFGGGQAGTVAIKDTAS